MSDSTAHNLLTLNYLVIVTNKQFNYSPNPTLTMVQHTVIGAFLTTCVFILATKRNFVMGNEGLDSWTAFFLIGYNDLASIANNASRYTIPFSIWCPQVEMPCCFEVFD